MARLIRFAELSIRQKLTWIVVITSGTAMLLLYAGVVIIDTRSFRQNMVRRLSVTADIVAMNSASSLLFNDAEAAEQTLAALKAEPAVEVAAIYGMDRRVFAEFSRPGRSFTEAPPAADAKGERFDAGHLMLYREIVLDKEMLGTLYVRADMGELVRRLASYALISALLLPFGFATALLAATRLQRHISGPLRSLVNAIHEVSAAKDYSIRVAGHTTDELGQLIESFNAMLAEIQNRDDALKRAHDGLELRVEERTQKLRQANVDLLQTQQQLVQAAKFESIGRLAAGAAHEVKNPLAIITMGIDYIQRVPAVSTEKEVPSVLENMRDAVHRADTVIRGLLDFSAQRKVELKRQGLGAVVEHALVLVKHELDKSHIRMDVHIEAGMPEVALDGPKFEQVLVNLFMNSVQAMSGTGALTIRVGRVSDAALSPDLRKRLSSEAVVQVSIEDTGPGVPPNLLPRLFDPFFTTKPTGQGTGLGLAVTKTIIEMHGGVVDIGNRPEGGAVARIMLPASPEKNVNPFQETDGASGSPV